jgi:uroporphyrinogen III methyltransferase/synthase
MTDGRTPLVYLVGAGPGDPGLVTLRAVECLRLADFVLYDKLAPAALLDYAPATARKVCVTELPGCHPERWPHIHAALIDLARRGQVVVRLKGGDPLVFGRGAEEAEALRAAGIPYEIVPGVTSALAAGAYAEVPITHRDEASAVAFVTGHENPHKPGSRLDWAALARFPGTLVVYMGMARLPQIVRALISHGKPPDTPAAAVHSASTGHQHSVRSTLGGLEAAVKAEGLSAPAIILIGSVVGRRPERSWFEARPLFGKRVLVTRPRGLAGEMLRKLERLGAVAHTLPALEFRDPPDWSAVDAALGRLGEFQWLVFTSANGVHSTIRRLTALGRDLRALGGVKLAAIGPATAEALAEYHLRADLVPPEEFRAEALAAALKPLAAGQRVLLARADRGRDVLRSELAAVAEVEQVAVYVQADAIDPAAESFDALRRGEIDFVTLTSPNIARAFLGALDEVGRARVTGGTVRLVTISPVTSAAVRELGFPVAAEATVYTTDGVIEALVALAPGG